MPNQSDSSAGDGAGAAEQQDERKSDHEGRRDDRQDASGSRSAFLKRNAGARRDQREGEPQRRRADADEASRGTACSRRRRSAGPNRGSRGPRSERSANLSRTRPSAKCAVVVLERRCSRMRQDRKEDEDADQGHDHADRADHEGVAAAPAARPPARGRAGAGRRSVVSAAPMPTPRWLGPGPNAVVSSLECPAVQSDREALQGRRARGRALRRARASGPHCAPEVRRRAGQGCRSSGSHDRKRATRLALRPADEP